MSSRAQGYRSRKRRRTYGPANKERRHRSLGVWRTVEAETSERITSALEILFSSDVNEGTPSWPAIKQIHKKHTLTILSPTFVKQRFAQGFEAGYNFHRSIQAIEELFDSGEDPSVKIGGVSVFGYTGRCCFVGIDIVDKQHRAEQLAIHRTLGKAGVRGFRGNGLKISHTSRIVIAQTVSHMHTEKEIREKNIVHPETHAPPMAAEQLASHIEQQFLLNGIYALNLSQPVVKAV